MTDVSTHGFYRFAAACPKMKVADTSYNTDQIIECIRKAHHEQTTVIVFPELCITGYTCNDLFHQEQLLKKAEEALARIKEFTLKECQKIIVAVGAPVRIEGRLYNCAVFIEDGAIIAVTPKVYLPNQREFYEKRYFSSGRELLRGIPKVCRHRL